MKSLHVGTLLLGLLGSATADLSYALFGGQTDCQTESLVMGSTYQVGWQVLVR